MLQLISTVILTTILLAFYQNTLHLSFPLIIFYAYIVPINIMLSPNNFFQQEREVKICFWLLLFIGFLKMSIQFFQKPRCWTLVTEDRDDAVPQHSNMCSDHLAVRIWAMTISSFCIFCWLAVSFYYIHSYLGTSLSDWRSISKRIPGLPLTSLDCFINIMLQFVDICMSKHPFQVGACVFFQVPPACTKK